MNLIRQKILITIALTLVTLLLFNMVWYMIAANLPPSIRGVVMITAVLLIVIVALQAYRGGSVFESVESLPDQKPTALAIIIVILVVACIIILPVFILFLVGVR